MCLSQNTSLLRRKLEQVVGLVSQGTPDRSHWREQYQGQGTDGRPCREVLDDRILVAGLLSEQGHRPTEDHADGEADEVT